MAADPPSYANLPEPTRPATATPEPAPSSAPPAGRNGRASAPQPAHGDLAPRNDQAEEDVLGGLMLAGNSSLAAAQRALVDVHAAGVQPNDFYGESHARVYAAIQDLAAQDVAPDLLAVTHHLEQTGSLREITGGAQRVTELAAGAVAFTNIGHWATIVHQVAQQRTAWRLQHALDRYAHDLSQPLTDPERQDLEQLLRPAALTTITEPVAVTLQEFLDLDLKAPPALLGTDADTIIPTGGLVVVAGMPGAGKTTLVIDAVYHLASGKPWLGFPVSRPLNILLIENEGPQHKFQAKLRNKTDTWQHPINGQIRVHTWKWGEFTFRHPDHAARLRHELDTHQIDIVIGDPLDTLGTEGVGSPENTSQFLRMLVPLGLTANRTFIFLHHFRKEVTISEINQVSGAWGQRLDTLLVLRDTDQPDELRLSFPKLRWGDETHKDNPLILGKLRATFGFEKLRVETHDPEPGSDAVEAMLFKVVGVLRQRGGAIERQLLAMHCETEPSNRTFQRALATGYHRDVLAKEPAGKKISYSLAPEAYL